MAETPETKDGAMSHVEDNHQRGSLDGIVPQREQRNIEALEDKYHIPVKEVLESHLDEDPKKIRRIMRKVDLRLIPILSLLYMWAFIDRSNLGNVCDPRVDCTYCGHQLTVNTGKHRWNESGSQDQHRQSLLCPSDDLLHRLLSC
jgi:hypothetical protein